MGGRGYNIDSGYTNGSKFEFELELEFELDNPPLLLLLGSIKEDSRKG